MVILCLGRLDGYLILAMATTYVRGILTVPAAHLQEPPDLLDFLAGLDGRSFVVSKVLAQAQALDGGIGSSRDLAELIESYELWDVFREAGRLIAVKKSIPSELRVDRWGFPGAW